MSKNEVKNIATEYAKFLGANKFPFESIYLFGSFAKGNPHEWSDIDIAVVSKAFSGNNWLENRFLLWKLRRSIDTRIEPLGISPEEFEGELTPMAYEIKKHGIKIR